MMQYIKAFILLCLFTSPVLAAESDNFNEYFKQSCEWITQEKYGDDWCNKGNANGKAPNTVIVGDSYGNSWVTVLSAYDKNNPGKILYEQYGRGECPSLLGHGKPWCSNFAQTVYDRIKQTPSIKTVLMAGEWGMAISGRSHDEKVNTKEASDQFKKSFVETIKAYQKLGKKVVVIYQAPHGYEPKTCIERRISLGSQESKCKLPIVNAMSREAYRGFFAEVLPSLKAASFDPFPLFCNDKECQMRDGEKIFHTRGIHLSRYGGEFIASRAKSELDALMQLPPLANKQ